MAPVICLFFYPRIPVLCVTLGRATFCPYLGHLSGALFSLISVNARLCSHVVLPGALYVLFLPTKCSVMSSLWYSAGTTKTSLQTSKN